MSERRSCLHVGDGGGGGGSGECGGGGLEYLQNSNCWRPSHATHHLHRTIERLAARGSDATCQESWQHSDAPDGARHRRATSPRRKRRTDTKLDLFSSLRSNFLRTFLQNCCASVVCQSQERDKNINHINHADLVLHLLVKPVSKTDL